MDEQLKTKLERLKATRTGNRSAVTRTINECDEILNNETLTEENVSRLEVLKQQLQGKLSTLQKIGAEFLTMCDLKDIEREIMESDDVETKIIVKTKRIEAKLNAMTKLNEVNDESSTSSAEVPQVNTTTHTPVTQVVAQNFHAKLPKLVLPKYKGEATKWHSFWDSFKSAVHENTTLSAIERFNYRISLLEGAAYQAVQGLTITEDNYNSAIELLHERFGKPQQIISAHMDELLKIQGCNDSDRHSSLRYVYDKITVHIRGLASLGVDSAQYGSLLIPIVMAKVPSELRLRIARVTKESVWKIDDLLEVIRQEVEAREVSERVKASDQRPPTIQRNKSSTASSLLSKSETDSERRNTNIHCAYCNDQHHSASCERFTDPKSRRDILFETKRCFKCLRTGHQVKDCKKPNNCRNCGGNHHQSVCLKVFTAGKRETKADETNIREQEHEASKTTTSTTNVKTKGTVLLQTATATAVNDDG